MDTYKQKYNEALERAKKLKETCDSTSVIGWCEYIFPELKESEDERIRKVLIGWINLEPSTSFNDTFDGFSKEQILAWLEKQKDTLKDTLKDIEQKPEWSEEDDENIMMIEDRFSDYLDYIREDRSLTKHRKNTLKEDVIGYVNWLKSLKNRVLLQPKQEWSEEDKEGNYYTKEDKRKGL